MLTVTPPTNTGSSIPAVSQNYGLLPDSYFWESASYIKLRALSVSYTLPEARLAYVKTLRFYLLGENLVTIKPHGTVMQDPETPGAGFPVPRRYTLGFEGTF